jgi:hypothetical protein
MEEEDEEKTRGRTRTTSEQLIPGKLATTLGNDDLSGLGDLHAAVVIEVEDVLAGEAVLHDPPLVRLVSSAEVDLDLLGSSVDVHSIYPSKKVAGVRGATDLRMNNGVLVSGGEGREKELHQRNSTGPSVRIEGLRWLRGLLKVDK